jgi:hypothetical protein
MIRFRTRVFPTARRLARIQAMHARYLNISFACGGNAADAHEYINHIMLDCPHWECHRRHFVTLVLEFGARRRRSGGGPGEGCARRPVDIPSPPRGGR